MKIREHESITGVHRMAWYSDCEVYRYALLIRWASAPPKCFIGLNPSTATELDDDPTIRRCIDYASRWGHGGLLMLNASAYRATDPKVMLGFDGDKIGPLNTISWMERIIVDSKAFTPVAAWGRHAKRIIIDDKRNNLNRADELRVLMGPLDCLGLNGDGTPVHPLYQRADLLPRPFNY